MPFAKINGKSLFYTIDEKDDRTNTTTALFIHGLGSSSCFYKAITTTLKQAARCIAFDTPGSGLSELGNEQSIETIAENVIGLLDNLRVTEKVIIVGHSLGGIVASLVASQHPERVKAVVLLGPVNPSPGLAEAFENRIEIVKTGRLSIFSQNHSWSSDLDGLEALANTIPAGATASASVPLQHAFIRSLILGTTPEGYMSLCRSIATAKTPNYSAIRAPLLILAGDEDKAAPLPSSQVIFDEYGTQKEKKKIEILPKVGHWHCVEAPELVSAHIIDFIETIFWKYSNVYILNYFLEFLPDHDIESSWWINVLRFWTNFSLLILRRIFHSSCHVHRKLKDQNFNDELVENTRIIQSLIDGGIVFEEYIIDLVSGMAVFLVLVVIWCQWWVRIVGAPPLLYEVSSSLKESSRWQKFRW
jgi:pimeloyl-ACP methyl ester carboxylesterase